MSSPSTAQAPSLPMNNAPKTSFVKKAFTFIKDYYVNSDQKLIAWLYLAGISILMLGTIAIMIWMSIWFPGFLAVMAQPAVATFWASIGQFAGILTAFVACHSLKDYLVGKLSTRWREWMTRKLVNTYLDQHNYLAIARTPEVIESVGQCIQEDILKIPALTLELVFGFIRSAASLGIFGYSLWILGGSVAIGLNIVIPGYFVWVALAFAIVSSVGTHLIGRSLAKKTQRKEVDEARLRENLDIVNKNSPNIAAEKAEPFHKAAIENEILRLRKSTNQQLKTHSLLVAFQSLYEQITFVLPYIASAPLILTGGWGFNQVMQLSLPFGEVANALGWFVAAYKDMAKWKAAMNRIFKVEQCFDANKVKVALETGAIEKNVKECPNHPHIIVFPGDRQKPGKAERKPENKGTIHFKHLSLQKDPKDPSEGEIFHSLDLKLKEKQNVVIYGDNGVGKSTLFRVISENRHEGHGKVTLPYGKDLYFLPTDPSINIGKVTLKELLAYPNATNDYTDEDYQKVFEAVLAKNHTDFDLENEKRKDWSTLSAGQRQQISIVRAILKKPDWLLMDESTRAMDSENEHNAYKAIKTLLPDATIVSVAHGQSVLGFHDKVIHLSVNKDKSARVVHGNVLWTEGKAEAMMEREAKEEGIGRPNISLSLGKS